MATITKRKWKNKSGEHEAWVLAFTDAKGKRHKEQFKTKRDADSRRLEVEGQVATGVFRADAKTKTVADACAAYLASLKTRYLRDARVTTTYLKTNQGEVWNYIAPELRPEGHDKTGSRVTPFTEGVGHYKLAQFTSSDVTEWTDRLIAAGLTVSTTRRLVATLSRILAHAITPKNWVAINVAKGVKVIGSRKTDGPKEITPPSQATLRGLLDKAEPALNIKILFAASSGLRASEQWALTWGDLTQEQEQEDAITGLIIKVRVPLYDPQKSGQVSVHQRVDIFGQLDTTKSTAGTRTVPIGKSVVAALLEWKRQTNHAADDDIVFPNSAGGYLHHGNLLKREFDPFKVEAGAPTLTWHAFRHYAVSKWIEAGLQPKVVQTFAGHKTLSITMDRYGHLFPREDHSDAIEQIAESLLA